MIRPALIATATLLTMAAAPQPLPLPPMPPDNAPTDTAAPIPDSGLRAPLTLANADPQVKLRLYRLRRPDGSMGFLPGSRFETSEERKAIQTPGISLSVPLQ